MYNVIKPFGGDSSKFSMRGRLNESKDKSSKLIVPGPGEYSAVATSASGRYPLSQFKNTSNIIWSLNKSTKFEYEGN